MPFRASSQQNYHVRAEMYHRAVELVQQTYDDELVEEVDYLHPQDKPIFFAYFRAWISLIDVPEEDYSRLLTTTDFKAALTALFG